MRTLAVIFILVLLREINSQEQQQPQQPFQQGGQQATQAPTQKPITSQPPLLGGPIQNMINPIAHSVQGMFHGMMELGKGVAGILQNTINSLFNSWTQPNFQPPPPVGFEYLNQLWQNQLNPSQTTVPGTTTTRTPGSHQGGFQRF